MNILTAFKLAARLHAGQVDKAGRPYIEHLSRVFLRVVDAGGDRDQQIAALFHDSIEDKKATAESLAKEGVPTGAISLVVILTRQQGQSYQAYLEQVRGFARAVLLKIADLEENLDPERLAQLDKKEASSLASRYRRALAFLQEEETAEVGAHD